MDIRKKTNGWGLPTFGLFFFVETVGLEANGLEKKPLFKALFGIWPSHPESPVTET